MEIFVLPLILVALLVIPVVLVALRFDSTKKRKIALVTNLCSFFAVLIMAAILPLGNFVGASEENTSAEETSVSDSASAEGLGYIAAALATGIGSIGCGIAVSSAASAAIGATAEEPKVFSKALIFVALGEGVALYGFLISFMILQKL